MDHGIPEGRFPSTTGAYQARQYGFVNKLRQTQGYNPQGFHADVQREKPGIPSQTSNFQHYIEKNDIELRRIHAIMYLVTSSALDIDRVVEETRRTPFTNRIASVSRHDVRNIKFPKYSGNSDL